MTSSLLNTQHCVVNAPALSPDTITALLPQVPGWAIINGKLHKCFAFHNYYETIAFVNALAWVSHQQDHHPELLVSYQQCTVSYATHSAGGALSENDFICAARASTLQPQGVVA